MYKIYYNDKLIRLCHPSMMKFFNPSSKKTLNVLYPGKVKYFHSYLNKLEKNRDLIELNIYFDDIKSLKSDFFSVFKIVAAAGGLVLNKKGHVLMIFRRGSWDLPKGKLDPGETKKEAALREVMEETGLKEVALIQKLTTTYHIYRTKNSDKRILKPSYWYVMTSQDKELIPQTEEDIEKVEWVPLATALSKKQPIFSSIHEVLRYFSNSF